jgi:hypothetical protein
VDECRDFKLRLQSFEQPTESPGKLRQSP